MFYSTTDGVRAFVYVDLIDYSYIIISQQSSFHPR